MSDLQPPGAAPERARPGRVPTQPASVFGRWLQGELDQRRWSRADLSRATGWPNRDDYLDQSSISKWILGKRVPDTASCMQLARALGLPAEEVIRRAGHPVEQLVPPSTDSFVKQRIIALVRDLPDPMLQPLVPMLEGLTQSAKRTGTHG